MKDLDRKDTLFNKEIEKAFMGASKDLFEQKVRPSTLTSKKLGNMYAASVYGSLASLLDTVPSSELQGKRIGLYSYGSGLAASFFSLRVKGSTDEIHQKLQLKERLGQTHVRSCEEYLTALKVSLLEIASVAGDVLTVLLSRAQYREEKHNIDDWQPDGRVEDIAEGAYYIVKNDKMHRRTYAIRGSEVEGGHEGYVQVPQDLIR